MHDFEFFILVEVEQVDLAEGVEVVARAGQDSFDGVLDLDVGHEASFPPAPPALRGAPGGAVVAPPSAVGALPEVGVPDRYGLHAPDTAALSPALLVGDLLLC